MTKTSIVLIGVAIIALLSISLIAIRLGGQLTEQKNIDEYNISTINDSYKRVSQELQRHKDTIASLQDSIIKLNVEKGQVEIELNRKESQFHDQVNRYYVYKLQRDTIQLLGNCDSIVNEVQPYVIQNFQYRRLIDTLYRKLVSVADQYDSISVIQSHLTDSVIRKNYQLARDSNNLQVKKLKAQRFGLIASIVAVAETAIIFLIK